MLRLRVFAWVMLALFVLLTIGSAVAAFKVKDVDKARETAEGFRRLRMAVAVIFILIATVAPLKRGLTALGVPALAAWPLTVLCPLLLALLLLSLQAADEELGFGGAAVYFGFVMTAMGVYLWVAGGWDLVDRYFGVP